MKLSSTIKLTWKQMKSLSLGWNSECITWSCMNSCARVYVRVCIRVCEWKILVMKYALLQVLSLLLLQMLKLNVHFLRLHLELSEKFSLQNLLNYWPPKWSWRSNAVRSVVNLDGLSIVLYIKEEVLTLSFILSTSSWWAWIRLVPDPQPSKRSVFLDIYTQTHIYNISTFHMIGETLLWEIVMP